MIDSSVINDSISANARIDMSLLFDRYYDRAETVPISDGPEVNQAANLNQNLSQNPSLSQNLSQNLSLSLEMKQAMGHVLAYVMIVKILNQVLALKDTDVVLWLSIAMGVLIIGVITVMYFSREQEDMVFVEQQFVPELPPMEPPKD